MRFSPRRRPQPRADDLHQVSRAHFIVAPLERLVQPPVPTATSRDRLDMSPELSTLN